MSSACFCVLCETARAEDRWTKPHIHSMRMRSEVEGPGGRRVMVDGRVGLTYVVIDHTGRLVAGFVDDLHAEAFLKILREEKE